MCHGEMQLSIEEAAQQKNDVDNKLHFLSYVSNSKQQ